MGKPAATARLSLPSLSHSFTLDGLVHCQTEQEAHAIKAALTARLTLCGLALHPDKTRMVYCKDGSRKGRYPNTQFDCLGYTFRPRVVKNRQRHSLFVSFTPAVSSAALKGMRQTTRRCNFRNRSDLSLEDIARYHNPVLRGGVDTTGSVSDLRQSRRLEKG